jgi:pSer/pThr/pTyr-binding forkhead associated (FHA) protein
MERCPNCGVETRPGDQFCLNCGNRLNVSQPAANPWGGTPAPGSGAQPAPGTPWFGGPGSSPSTPTGPTMQAFNPGSGPAPDDPTMVTPPEVLEPTARAPGMAPVGSGPAMAYTPGSSGPAMASMPTGTMPTMATTPEVLEPTAFAPPPLPYTPPAPAAAEEPAPVWSSPNLATQMATDSEEAEATVTMVDETPAKLVVTRNGQAREFLLKKPDITIGRAPSNDIALSGDQLASRRHALIRFDGVNFTIRDVGSANGTYINGVELRAPTPLRNGDHIGVGEHEIVFFTVNADEEAEPVTMTIAPPDGTSGTFGTVAVPGHADTLEPSSPWATLGDSQVAESLDVFETEDVVEEDEEVGIATGTDMQAEATISAEEAIPTMTVSPGTLPAEAEPEEQPAPFFTQEPAAFAPPPEADMPEATIIESIVITEDSRSEATEVEEEEEAQIQEPLTPADRFYVEPVNEEDMPLPVPQLPEIPTILTAIKSLDETTAEMREHLLQAKALEEQAQQLRDQLRVASDTISSHDNSVAVLAQRLRVGVADVSNRLNKVIEEVTRADESLSIADMMKLIDDVRNDPRDIYTLGSLARRARELAQFFEMHQHVNQILSECLMTLNGLLADELAKAEGDA